MIFIHKRMRRPTTYSLLSTKVKSLPPSLTAASLKSYAAESVVSFSPIQPIPAGAVVFVKPDRHLMRLALAVGWVKFEPRLCAGLSGDGQRSW